MVLHSFCIIPNWNQSTIFLSVFSTNLLFMHTETPCAYIYKIFVSCIKYMILWIFFVCSISKLFLLRYLCHLINFFPFKYVFCSKYFFLVCTFKFIFFNEMHNNYIIFSDKFKTEYISSIKTWMTFRSYKMFDF